ncbi:hypothetical protein KFL_005970020 [Klebsormidium nitens]|uniref:Uncharacterized protein n=1 Tax=Klebsormidium nitens TaxID=105231 RepID=A0A1Y1ILR3_KLENI|nr:hypothetical protein KFL_005970020 [Klebsormidium nitens]|eukprot:GAQ90081.1 hypothetical protein KFL_005970020 [Klebsormidium nitens]
MAPSKLALPASGLVLLLSLLLSVSLASAQTSLCDKYTKALLTDVTPENEYLLLTLLVNRAFGGNFTATAAGINVPGILAPGVVNGEAVNLLPYFNGQLKTTNEDNQPASVNFLDGGGVDALKQNLPAFDRTSNQYFLLTHLYQFFGVLLGCSQQSSTRSGAFPAYRGDVSMYQVHKFMALDNAQVMYFNGMVGTAFASFGGAPEDVAAVVAALNGLFGVACGDFYPIAPYAPPALQSVCTVEGCPLASPPRCDLYADFGAAVNDEGTAPLALAATSPTSCDASGSTPNLCYNAAGSAAICCASQCPATPGDVPTCGLGGVKSAAPCTPSSGFPNQCFNSFGSESICCAGPCPSSPDAVARCA